MICNQTIPLYIMLIAVCCIFPSAHSVLAYQLPDTGQHTCYDDQGNEITCPEPGEPFYGQDAQYQGPEPTYQDNGDGTVTDLNTGLIWMQNTADTDGDGDSDGSDDVEWQAACDYCADLSYAGHTDWRLPDRRELVSIVDYTRYKPAINPVFGCRSSYWEGHSWYWSGSTDDNNPDNAWKVYFRSGMVGYTYKGYGCFVRCVRSGQ